MKNADWMEVVTLRQWEEWKPDCGVLPFVRSVADAPFPDHWRDWWREEETSFLLETRKQGRHTILAIAPNRLWLGTEDGLRTWAGDQPMGHEPGNPLALLREKLRELRSPRLPVPSPFTGGVIGYFSYDLVRLLERMPAIAQRDLDLPLFAFGLCLDCWVYDHLEKVLHCCSNVPVVETGGRLAEAWAGCQNRTREMADFWLRKTAEPGRYRGVPVAPVPSGGEERESTFSKESYARAVLRVQELITSGDTYQTNLSLRQSRPLHASPGEIYDQLRRINPSPYMALVRLPEMALVCGSPELLVSLRDRRLQTRPIAGTRPRGDTGERDDSLRGEMMASPKERAEHLMLVDLLRNDLGRVSAYGSVRVSEYMTVEHYSHVMHIVSHITGDLAAGKDAFDVIAAVFPGGTITGAPKVRTMEIIEELEPVRRGPYTGSVGWIGFHGDMELNITIRTLLIHGGRGYVQAGAGIVADSVPEHEYEESLSKGKALWAAVEAAEATVNLVMKR